MEEIKCQKISAREDAEAAASLDPLVKEWFISKFKSSSIAQRYGVLPIFERKNILISAPTNETKT
jgi:Lhr-like helicase